MEKNDIFLGTIFKRKWDKTCNGQGKPVQPSPLLLGNTAVYCASPGMLHCGKTSRKIWTLYTIQS